MILYFIQIIIIIILVASAYNISCFFASIWRSKDKQLCKKWRFKMMMIMVHEGRVIFQFLHTSILLIIMLKIVKIIMIF